MRERERERERDLFYYYLGRALLQKTCLMPAGCGRGNKKKKYLWQYLNYKDFLYGNLTSFFICDRCLVVPMQWPVNLSSCPEADPLLSLSEPLASLSLRDESESSSTTYR